MTVQIEFSETPQSAWDVFEKILAAFTNNPSFDGSSLTASTPGGDEIKFTGSVSTTSFFGVTVPTGGTLNSATITCGGAPFMKLTGLNEGVGAIWSILTGGGLKGWFEKTLAEGTVQEGSDGADDCTDLFAFLTGNDVINGGLGLDTLLSGSGDDVVRGGADADVISTGEGSDVILGTLDEFAGDTIQDFSSSDLIRLLGVKFNRSDITRDGDTAIWSIDRDGDGTGDDTMTINGSLSGGDLLAFALNGDCYLRFAEYLQPLADGVAVVANGLSSVENQDFLTGNGSIGFRVSLKLDKAAAAFVNSLGVYEVDKDGNIVDVQFIAKDVTVDVGKVDITGVEDGHKLGFFIVQDGANWAKSLADSDTLSFIDKKDGSAATVADGSDVTLALNGAAAGFAAIHSFDKSLNADGMKHAIGGVDVGGASITIGFEDLLVGADNDCQDVVFCVETFDI